MERATALIILALCASLFLLPPQALGRLQYSLEHRLEFREEIEGVAVSSDGSKIAFYLSNGTLFVAERGRVAFSTTLSGSLWAMEFSPSGSLLVLSTYRPDALYVVDLASGEVDEYEVSCRPNIFAFSADEVYLAVGERKERLTERRKSYVCLVDLARERVLWTREVVNSVHEVYVGRDGRSVVALTTETFCSACLEAKQKKVRVLNMQGNDLAIPLVEWHVEDLVLLDDLLVLVRTKELAFYELVGGEFEKVREFDTRDLGSYSGKSPSGRWLLFRKRAGRGIEFTVLDLRGLATRTKKLLVPEGVSFEHEALVLEGGRIVVKTHKAGVRTYLTVLDGRSEYSVSLKGSYKVACSTRGEVLVAFSKNVLLAYEEKEAMEEDTSEEIEEEPAYYRLRIEVVDERGAPLSGASLEIPEIGIRSTVENGTLDLLLPPGAYTVVASREGYFSKAEVVEVREDLELRLVLERELYELVVRVLRGGEAEEGAMVSVYNSSGFPVAEGSTGSNGTASFRLPTGSYRVIARAGEGAAEEVVEVYSDATISLEIPLLYPLTLKIPESFGECLVYVMDEKGHIVARLEAEERSEARVLLGPGVYSIFVKSEHSADRMLEVEVTGPTEVELVQETPELVHSSPSALYVKLATIPVAILAVCLAFLERMGRWEGR